MSIKNILLIRTTNYKNTIPPLGLLYIASSIRATHKECNIKVMDFTLEGFDEVKFKQEIAGFSPEIIGFSSLSSEFVLFKKLCDLAREVAPKSILIGGGILATGYYSNILKNKLVDFSVIGEGEITIVELLEAINTAKDISSVKGIAYLKDNEVVLTPQRKFIDNLDEIPLPAWDLIDLKSYSKMPNWNGILREKYYAPIMTSRGCSYRCIYCHNLFGKNIRARTVENVLSEIELLYKNYGVREFHIIDDFFNFDLERVGNICNGIIKKRLKIKISFPNGMRVDRMDRKTLLLLKKAGTYKINYAIETASLRLQKFIKKNINLEKANEIISETSRMGIITFGFFMFGFPTETAEEISKTISFAVRSEFDTAKFLKVTAFNNTELAKLTPDFIYGDDLRYFENRIFYDDNINYTELSDETLNAAFLEVYWKFYSKLSRIFRIVIKYRKLDVVRRLFVIYSYVLSKNKDKRKDAINSLTVGT